MERGQLVGMPTAGNVISTTRKQIVDVGVLQLPFRGRFLAKTGQDMELNGAMPDHMVGLSPGKQVEGNDAQLEKAVQVLPRELEANQDLPIPPRFSSERHKKKKK